MSNDFYNHNDGIPGDLTRGDSSAIRDEFDLVKAGFDRLPTGAQLWSAGANYVTAAGPADAWTVALATNPAAFLTAYTDGMQLRVLFPAANVSATPTININGLGVKTIAGDAGNPLLAGDLVSGAVRSLTYSASLGKFIVFLGNSVAAAAAGASTATAQAALATAAAATATTQGGLATAAATTATTQAGVATVASATLGGYANTASANVPRGLTQASVGAITAGSSGTNGTFALAWSGGNFSVNPTGTFTVAGGVLTAVTITGPGLYIGGAPSVPTPSFAASSGLSGAGVVLTAQFLVASGQGYWVQSADNTQLLHYLNSSGTATADNTVGPVSLQSAQYLGVAVPATNPGALSAASRSFYTAITPGTYTNFGSLVVNSGEIAALRWTGAAWTKDTVFTFNTPNVILGEVVKGAIYPFDTGVSTQVAVKVQPGTVIVGYNDTKKVHINVTAGQNLLIDSASTHPGINGTSTGLLYCSLAGQLGITNGTTNLPSGEYVLIGYIYQAGVASGGGAGGALFSVAPILPTNHFYYSRANDLMCWPKQDKLGLRVNVKNLGAVGDGVTDDSEAFLLWHWLARGFRVSQSAQGWWSNTKTPFELFFPAGTYLTTLLVGESDCRYVGESKTGSTIKCATLLATSIFQAEDLTLWNLQLTQGSAQPDLARYLRVLFKFDAGLTSSATYLVNPGTKDYDVRECEWQYATVFIPLYVTNFRNVLIERNIFNQADTGYASHAMRIETPSTMLQNVIVRENWIWNGTTGIFFGSNRVMPTENVLVERNRVYHVAEEGISFDGFGNNTSLCPIIASGTITAVSNDANGRLVVTPSLLYNPSGTPNQALAISGRADWTNFYFSLEDGTGTGVEGSYVRIYAFDGTAGTLTLDSYIAAADVTTGGSAFCGVHAGFFNCTVRNNQVEGSVGTAGSVAHSYATAFSIYLNVFGFKIHDNRAVGCANGINVAGGQMLTTYRSLAWDNHVYDNDFVNCNRIDPSPNNLGDSGVMRFTSVGGTFHQFGNKCMNNNVVGGKTIALQYQKDFTYSGNVTQGITRVFRQFCAQALPTAGPAWVGRVQELITEDGSGNATDIHYYVCKAVAGVYSWVQIA